MDSRSRCHLGDIKTTSPPSKPQEALQDASLANLLTTSAWTRDLTVDQIRMVKRTITERFVATGGYVCRRGEPVEYWFGIIDGFAKICSDSPAGRSITFTCLWPGSWFGEGSLLKDEPRRFDVIALRDVRVACLPRTSFHRLLETSMAFNRFLVTQLNERLGQFVGMLEFERTLPPDIRVARSLVVLFNPQLYPRASMRLSISQEEIACLCGLSRQTVNQALHALEGQGWLSVGIGGITITDLRGLQAFASSNDSGAENSQ
jgi:CRP/FNR family transcriptional regulator, cyclic AMP receptor protein